MDQRLQKLADILVNYSLDIKPEQVVTILGDSGARDLMLAVYQQIIEAGGHPLPVPNLSGADEVLLKHGSDKQITWISPMQKFISNEADATITILSESNTRRLSGIDPGKQQLAQQARRELMQTYMQRAAVGELNWCVTLMPTNAYAQDADMSLDDYTEFVFAACQINAEDPVQYWVDVSRNQARLIDWLSPRTGIHITGPDTDLRLSVAGRTWINADGKRNFPDGEIFTGPVENSVEGRVRFTYPALVQGREVEDIQLWFESGNVIKATASKNQAYLDQMLDADEGAKHLGEFAFGTNFGITRFTKNTLFDEKIGGTIHMALGAGYPDSGSTNKSAIHWDMVCDLRTGGEVTVDGELFMKDGEFLV